MSFQIPSRRGQDHPAAKLNNRERENVRKAVRSGQRPVDLAKTYRVSPGTIRRIGQMPSDWLK